jgi:hypothetical protein
MCWFLSRQVYGLLLKQFHVEDGFYWSEGQSLGDTTFLA